LDNYLKEKKDISSLKPLEKFRKALKMCVDSDLEIISTILNKEQDDTSTLSSGLNSRNYFDIISNDKEEGIYIIDQPEDDVSQKAIKDCLLADFKKMADNRQIILITHNPQFVVNLDVDNVICMTKKDDKIEVKYGALEFEDEDKKTNIIEIVADNLDGGVESIKKRWKRYGKEINS
jgi:predicted ATP-dependent endonuclease of OLD family